MDTAYIIIIAGVTGAIGLVLFAIHLIQAARHGQALTRIALAVEREAQGMTGARDTVEPFATSPPSSSFKRRLGEGIGDTTPPPAGVPAEEPVAASSSTQTFTEMPDPFDEAPVHGGPSDSRSMDPEGDVLAVLSGRDDWPARGLIDGVWRDLRTLAALANGAEGSAAIEELDVAEHLGPTLEGLAGRLEVALNDLQAYPAPPPRPGPKDPTAS